MSYQRPANPALARVFDEAIRKGHEIRYADETQVVTWQRNQLGCAGLIILIALLGAPGRGWMASLACQGAWLGVDALNAGCVSAFRRADGLPVLACLRAAAACCMVSRLWCQWHLVTTSSTVVFSSGDHRPMCAASRLVVSVHRPPAWRVTVQRLPSRRRHSFRTFVGTWVGLPLSQGM